MVKFYALITHLYNGLGHRYVYHRCFQKAVQDLGYPYLGFTNKECPIPDMPSDWIRCLQWRDEKKRLKKVHQFFLRLFAFCKIFNRKNPQKEKRVFFLESFCRIDFLALFFSIFLFSKKEDRFLFLLRFDLRNLPTKKKAYYTLLINLFRWKLKHRLIFLTDSERVGHFFSSQRQATHLVPIPHTDVNSFSEKPLSTPIILWWPGEPRLEKGKNEVIALSQTTNPLANVFHLYLSGAARSFISQKHLPVVFLKDELLLDEYRRQLIESDIILLPYDPKEYYSRTSGIFIEAIFAGKIPLVKEGSWLALELEKHQLPELIVDWEQNDLLSYIHQVAHDSNMLEKLKKMRDFYRDFHSQESYTKTLREVLHLQELLNDNYLRNHPPSV